MADDREHFGEFTSSPAPTGQQRAEHASGDELDMTLNNDGPMSIVFGRNACFWQTQRSTAVPVPAVLVHWISELIAVGFLSYSDIGIAYRYCVRL